MKVSDAEYQKNLDSEEAIAAYLKGALKRNDESYLRHCQANAVKARVRLLAAKEDKHQQ